MKFHDLLLKPVWQGEELGRAIPPSPHAVSVALPRWQDVVGYEEKLPAVMDRLESGYPRFVIHRLVREVADALAGGRPCLPFPSRRAAEMAADFARRTSGAEMEIVTRDGLCGVATTEPGFAALKNFWQHTGLIVSTRQAEAFLAGHAEDGDAPLVRASLRRQLATIEMTIIEAIWERDRLLAELRWQSQVVTDELAGGWLAAQGAAAVEPLGGFERHA